MTAPLRVLGVLASASLFTTVNAVSQCDIAPLQLPWSNTTVTADGLGVTRGMEFGIGTPNQIFAFRPSTTLNNTRINNILTCVNSANDTCVGGAGGVFDPSKSGTYKVSIKAAWNGSQIDQESSTGSYVYFNDAVDFQSNGHVAGFPLVLASEANGAPQSGLPLGTNSSFLRAAVMGKVAPSTTFGLWTGSRSLAPVDGLLVVGGYDKARISGPFTNFTVGNWSLKRSCPLQVTITGLEYAGQTLFANSSESMIACVEPSVQRNVFTPSVATKFASLTGQNSSAYSGMRYNASAPPSGDLKITLQGGYSTTITNDELFALLRGSDSYGRYAVTNNTVTEAGVADNRKDDPNSVLPTLGGLFLTFNYLLVDYESRTFGLAPVYPSNKDVGHPNIATVCTPTATPEVPSPTPTPESKHSHAGAIAGGVIGGLAGLALIGALAFFLIRRRSRRVDDGARTIDTSTAFTESKPPTPNRVPTELETNEVQAPVEMPTSRNVSMRRPEGWQKPSPVAEPTPEYA